MNKTHGSHRLTTHNTPRVAGGREKWAGALSSLSTELTRAKAVLQTHFLFWLSLKLVCEWSKYYSTHFIERHGGDQFAYRSVQKLILCP
jgi:hypothetical protein